MASRSRAFILMGMAAVEADRAHLPQTREALCNARVAYLQNKPELCVERLTWALFTARLETWRKSHTNPYDSAMGHTVH